MKCKVDGVALFEEIIMESLPIISNISEFLKQPLHVELQLLKLLNRGLIVHDFSRARTILLSTNYYHLTGYLHHCKATILNPEDPCICAEIYDTPLTFDDISNLITFDSKLRSILMYSIDYVERELRTIIAYHMSQTYEWGNIAYMYEENFKDKVKHKKLMEYFKVIVDNNKKNSIVIHHQGKYEGFFPIWVAVELMTLGNLEALYNLLDDKTKDIIAREYSMKVEHFENHLMFTRKLRNMIAHNSRLYKFRVHPVPDNRIKYKSEKVFDSVVTLKEIFSNSICWNNDILPKLENLFYGYKDFNPIDWGFPTGWEEILTIKKPLRK